MLGFQLHPSARFAQRPAGGGPPPPPPPTIGPAVFLIAGQSNSVGWVAHDGGSIHPANVYQWSRAGGASGASGEGLLAASVGGVRTRLDHHDADNAGWAGLDIALSEALVSAYPGRDIVFVPCGKGGTGFDDGGASYDGQDVWNVGETLATEAIARANACMAALSGATFEGIIWHQGERNGASGTGAAEYAGYVAALIASFRASITGASAAPVIAGEMLAEYVEDRGAGGAQVQDGIRALPASISRCAVASSEGLSHKGDRTHFDAASYHTLGGRYAALLTTAQADATTVPGAVDDLAAADGEGEIVLTWTAPDPNGTPVAGYVIQRSEDQSTWTEVVSLDRDTLTYTDLGATPDTTTYYRVAADSGVGASAWSNIDSATATLAIAAESGASAHWFLPAQAADLVSSQALTTSGTTSGAGYLELLDAADYIRTGRTDTSEITIACVIRLDPASGNYVQVMGTRASDGGAGETGMGLFRQASAFKGKYSDGAEDKAISPAVKEEWTFLALSVDASNVLTLHRIGGAITDTKFQTAAARGTTGSEIALGAGYHTQPTENPYVGGFRVAEIIVWEGQALVAADLQAVGLRSVARCAGAGLTVDGGA